MSVQTSIDTASFAITTSNLATYKIFYGTSAASLTEVGLPGLNTSQTYDLTGLKANTTYYFKVRVVDTNGNVTESDLNDFTTWSDSNNPDGTVAQRVLSSQGKSADIVSINVSPSLKTDNKLTVEAWVKPTNWRTAASTTNSTADEVIISKGTVGGNIDYALSLDNGKLVYSNNDAGIWTCNAVVPLNVWTHVAATVDESAKSISLYVNGNKVSGVCEGSRGVFNKGAITKQYSITNSNSTSSDVYIGNYYARYCGDQDKTNGFIGRLDDIRIWNIPRTEAEIRTNMRASVKNTLGLVAYWTFDGGTVADITSFANDGAIRGSMQVVADSSATSTVVSEDASGALGFNYNFETTAPCEEKVLDEATTTPDDSVEVGFSGIVEYVGYCGGSDGNPNRYSQVIIKPYDSNTPVVVSVDASPESWKPTYGGADGTYGMNDPKAKLVLRHTPSSGPLPKVGECVLGTANGEPDTCSETKTPIIVDGKPLPTGQTLGSLCKGGKKGYVAGGIITTIGSAPGKDCKAPDEGGGGGNFFTEIGDWVAGVFGW
jgi:hypothetical protein